MIPAVTRHRGASGSTATFDPAKTQSGQTLSNGNLTLSTLLNPAAANRGTQSTTSHSTGKFYMEISADNCNSGTINHALFLGFCDVNCNGVLSGTNNFCYGCWDNGYGLLNNSVNSSGFGGYNSGDIIGMTIDCASGGAPIFTFYKNNTQMLTFTASGWSAPYFIFAAATSINGTVVQATANFGANVFNFSPPAGFTGGW